MKQLANLLRYTRLYGLRLAFFYLIYPRIRYGEQAFLRRHYEIKRFLKRRYNYVIDKYRDQSIAADVIPADAPIWICWLQGYDAMPELAKICYHSVCENRSGREVILIDNNNLDEYLNIPPIIKQKVSGGELSLTHYADYIRVALLHKYGGLWIDATIFVTDKITQDIGCQFYSIKQQPFSVHYVSSSKWVVGCMGSAKSTIAFSALLELFESYIKDRNHFIDFFLLDYCIATLYDELPQVRDIIDAIPLNNPEFYTLNSVINNAYDENTWCSIKKETSFHRLSRKSSYYLQTDNNIETFWGKLKNSGL